MSPDPQQDQENGLPDAEALRQWQGDDLGGFETLYRRHFPLLYRWLLWRLQDPEEAEDLAQETFLRALQCRDTLELEEGSSLYPWLHTVAAHLLADLQRRRKATAMSDLSPALARRLEASLLSTQASPEDVVLAREWRAALRRAVTALPEDQRQVVEYRFFADLPWREIARAVGRSEGAVKMLLQRALRRLRRTLQDEIEAVAPPRIRRRGMAPQEEAPGERTHRGRQRPPLRGSTGAE